MSSKHQINMCEGALVGKMILFSVPLMITGALQLLYNAADIIVVGQFAGQDSLSAVGSTGPLVNLLINIFMGLSVGTSVVTSKYFGARDFEGMQKTVHCSIAVALFSGIFVGAFGFIAAEPLLLLMNTPANVIGKSTLYVQIFFLGMPFNMLYNFGSAILRAVGDTKRPLYFLSFAGIINVILNLIFVIFLKMDVAGVALATITAQAISCVLVIRCLLKSEEPLKLHIKKLKIHWDIFIQLVKIGLPAGIQGSFFSISNMLIQSSINSFGSVVMAGNAASASLEGFVYTGMNAISQATITFTSANVGAKQYKRVRKCLWYSLALVTIVGLAISWILILFSAPLISLYNSDPEVILIGVNRFFYVAAVYFLCGAMEVMVSQLRGIGYSMIPMIVTLCGVCVIRVIWIYTIFQSIHTVEMLYLSYPFTWSITTAMHFITYKIIARKKLPKHNELST